MFNVLHRLKVLVCVDFFPVSHSDYQRPPTSYHPSTTKQSFQASVPFLHTKVPLPYSQTDRESETAVSGSSLQNYYRACLRAL